MNESPTVGVLLVNTGSPDKPTPRAVRKYLKQFLSDPHVVSSGRLAWWFVLRFIVLPRRSSASAQRYRGIWTENGSPIIESHAKLAHALEERFAEEFGWNRVMVRFAMSYGKPRTVSAFKEFKVRGIDHVIVVPTYPQSAISTTKAAMARVEEGRRKARFKGSVEYIEDYCKNPVWYKAIAASVLNAGFVPGSSDKLLLSFHSIPLEHIEMGDSYEHLVGSSALSITDELGIDRKQWTLAFQSPFGDPSKWLQPYSVDVLSRWGEVGVPRAFVVNPGFATECLETLYDIPQDLEPAFLEGSRSAGVSAGQFVYVPCLGKSKAHVKVLADVIRPSIKECFNG